MLKTEKGISFAVNKDDIEKKSWPNDGMRRSFSIYYHLVISFIEIGDITNHLFEQVIYHLDLKSMVDMARRNRLRLQK